MSRSRAGAIWPFLATLAIVLAGPARADDAPAPLAPGSRIRVTAPGLDTRTPGTLVALASDSLRFRSDAGESRTLPLDSVERLDRSLGTKGNTVLGMGTGMIVGALIGNRYGSDLVEGESKETNPELTKLGYMLIGAGCGLLIGGLVGGAIRSERWETLPPESWRLGLDFDRGSAGLRIALRF